MSAQIPGCTDARATNFNPAANQNDGSCLYAVTSYSLVKLNGKLSDTINETSGLINLNGELWTINDSGSPANLYHFSKQTGEILQTIHIRNATNIDWEDIATDGSYIYIGDFGNNNGNRSSMSVYKIAISRLSSKTNDTITADTIRFSYADQTDFSSRPNANRYDCEAMMVLNDTIHLFSKDWIDGHTRHYQLPVTPGMYSLLPADSMDAGCLITGAAWEPVSRRIVLTGYQKTGSCFLWLLWDFKGSEVFRGNKRKIDLGFFTGAGQIEGVCFNDSSNVYVTNENNIVNNRLYGAQVGLWMNRKSAGVNYRKQDISALQMLPNPAGNTLHVKYNLQRPGVVLYCIYGMNGNLVNCTRIKENGGEVHQTLDISALPAGAYFLLVHSQHKEGDRKIFIKE